MGESVAVVVNTMPMLCMRPVPGQVHHLFLARKFQVAALNVVGIAATVTALVDVAAAVITLITQLLRNVSKAGCHHIDTTTVTTSLSTRTIWKTVTQRSNGTLPGGRQSRSKKPSRTKTTE